jgi:hypothetical protein
MRQKNLNFIACGTTKEQEPCAEIWTNRHQDGYSPSCCTNSSRTTKGKCDTVNLSGVSADWRAPRCRRLCGVSAGRSPAGEMVPSLEGATLSAPSRCVRRAVFGPLR